MVFVAVTVIFEDGVELLQKHTHQFHPTILAMLKSDHRDLPSICLILRSLQFSAETATESSTNYESGNQRGGNFRLYISRCL